MPATCSVGREEQVTASAGAQQATRLDVDQVAVLVGDRLGAQLAPLSRPRRLPRTCVAQALEHGQGVVHDSTSEGQLS
jgi:hypothetical protein